MSDTARGNTHSRNLTCTYCNAAVDLREYNAKLPIPQIMIEKQLCFDCAFWMDKINHPYPCCQIINGEYYIFNQWLDSPHSLKGYDGKSFYIRLNNGNVLRSNNLQYHGVIPERFRYLLPDTAKFITKIAYNKIKHTPLFQCRAKGCWDRYHCFWYDETIEVNGAWNEIPADHQIGDEYCESFLNKNCVYE